MAARPVDPLLAGSLIEKFHRLALRRCTDRSVSLPCGHWVRRWAAAAEGRATQYQSVEMLLALLALLMRLSASPAPQTEPTACPRWKDCQQLALDAAAREDFETFHSLAWRAVQSGPANDADLMFMLARAQTLSGRAHDALVMLGRLVDRGIVHPEVETTDDFRRVRSLAGWPNLLDRMHGVAPPTVAPPTASDPMPSATPAANLPSGSSSASRGAPDPAGPSAGSIPIPAPVTAPVAMAYDHVSGRVVIADDSSDTIKVLSELSGNAVDLVSRGWGGGYHTTALAIDPKRGDLWVVGARANAGRSESVVHRMQLISGRLLYTVPPPADSGATRFAAVARAAASVLVLDVEGARIFELGAGAKTLRLRLALPQRNLTGLTLAGNDVAYVAHAGGLVRIGLATKLSTGVKSSLGIRLEGIEWIGHFENSILAVQRQADGTMAAVRFRFDRSGRTAMAVDTFGAAASRGAAVLGDTFFYVSALPDGGTAVERVNLRSRSRAAPPATPTKRP